MAAGAVIHDLPPHRSGTTWLGWAVRMTQDGVEVVPVAAEFTIVNRDGDVVTQWTMEPAAPGLTYELDDPDDPESDMVLKIHGPDEPLTLEAGRHHFYLAVDLATGERFVDWEGDFKIVEAVPQPVVTP